MNRFGCRLNYYYHFNEIIKNFFKKSSKETISNKHKTQPACLVYWVFKKTNKNLHKFVGARDFIP